MSSEEANTRVPRLYDVYLQIAFVESLIFLGTLGVAAYWVWIEYYPPVMSWQNRFGFGLLVASGVLAAYFNRLHRRYA